VVMVVAPDWDAACDVASGEVFEKYENQCNLVDYECSEGILAN
jgi:hypothetical protein